MYLLTWCCLVRGERSVNNTPFSSNISSRLLITGDFDQVIPLLLEMRVRATHMSASARLAVSLSMATLVTRENALFCTPLEKTHAKAEMDQKQSLVELGLAKGLYVKPACPATSISGFEVNWHEMGLVNAVRTTAPCPVGRRLSLPLRTRAVSKPKQLKLPAMGDAVNRVLQKPAKPPSRTPKRGTAQPTSEGRALSKWLGR